MYSLMCFFNPLDAKTKGKINSNLKQGKIEIESKIALCCFINLICTMFSKINLLYNSDSKKCNVSQR